MSFFDDVLETVNPLQNTDYFGNIANLASNVNQNAQRRIKRGLANIEAVFGGGPLYTVTPKEAYDPSQQYYLARKGGFRKVPGAAEARPGLMRRMLRAGHLYTLNQSPGFGGMYDQYMKDYLDFAQPQVASQYRDAFNQAMYNFSNQGLMGGSAWEQQQNKLAGILGQQERGIADTARSGAQELQQGVLSTKQNLINQLYTTTNPNMATYGALSAASQVQPPSSFAPIMNAFTGALNSYYGSQMGSMGGFDQMRQGLMRPNEFMGSNSIS